jgi:cysteine desulfurase family protein
LKGDSFLKNVYLDNAATTFPKPKEVGEAVYNYITNIGANAGRGTYEESYNVGRVVLETRKLICELFKFDNPRNVIFTSGITESLNVLIKGYLNKGDHVIISSIDHNSVVRPIRRKELEGVEVTVVPCNIAGQISLNDLKQSIKSNTKLVLLSHVSNVCGTIMPIEEIGRICKENNINFIIDCAQSAGVINIDFNKCNLSALPFTGHKGLLGPQGIGGFILKDEFAEKLTPFKDGGTGSFSELEIQPCILPDKFESGTMNIPGIYGLNEALKFIKRQGVEAIYEHEKQLGELFLEDILNMDDIILHGLSNMNERLGVFSLTFRNIDNAEMSFMLDKEFGIRHRVGLHCAPLAHKALGTFPQGTLRISVGYFNKKEDIIYLIDSISKAIKKLK